MLPQGGNKRFSIIKNPFQTGSNSFLRKGSFQPSLQSSKSRHQENPNLFSPMVEEFDLKNNMNIQKDVKNTYKKKFAMNDGN